MTTNPNYYGGMTLKALLENPDLQHPPSFLYGNNSNSKENLKEKKGGSNGPEVDFTSAFLGPQLWDKTYDMGDFNLEYMDLDEFLCENGIPGVEPGSGEAGVASPASPGQPGGGVGSVSVSPQLSPRSPAPKAHIINPMLAPKLEKADSPKPNVVAGPSSPLALSPGATPPISPVPVQVEFSITEQDIALASIPGQGVFDPTRAQFSEEELKPQPMIKKSRKVFVPDDLKDDRYWARRKKNNYAAKRSRDARRVKENQIAMRAAYLEKENGTLREEMDKIRKENAKLKLRLSKYEDKSST